MPRLYNFADDAGTKDMLSFLIARDTMHQQQWLAVIEELGGPERQFPIPNSTPQDHEATEHSYHFLNTSLDEPTPEGRWTSDVSLDGPGKFTARDKVEPLGRKPELGRARPDLAPQKEQM